MKLLQKILIPPAILISIAFFISCTSSDGNKSVKNVFPGDQWDTATAESPGVDPAILDSALKYFNANAGGAGTDEMMVIRNGYVIWKGGGTKNRHPIYSCTKIYTSTVMGVLVKQGKLSVDDAAVDYLPGLDDGSDGQEAYSLIRFRDLATMTAGYQAVVTDCWNLHLEGRHDESYECTKKYIIPGRPQYTPRTRISYRDANVHMLGYILTKTAGKSLSEVFKENIADKTGMTNWEWSDYGMQDGIIFNNPAGTPNDDDAHEINEVQGGIWTTPEDLARLGLLYLNRGTWKGDCLLDSAFTVMASTNQVPAEIPATGVDLAGRYGFYWWTNGVRKDGTRPWPSAPPQTATPHGRGSNFCFIVPEWNMVIVRMSPHTLSAIPSPADNIWEGFFNILKEGIVTF